MRLQWLFIFFVFGSSSFAQSTKCIYNGKPLVKIEDIIGAIAKQSDCDSAVRLAIDCEWSSSADLQINQPAFEICQKDLATSPPNVDETSIYESMKTACHSRANQEGSLDVSMESQCRLRALNWLVNLTDSDLR